jgi:hypothetical protein
MRGLLSNLNFSVPILAAIAMTTILAVAFGAALDVVANILALGVLAVFVEYLLRSTSDPRQ